MKWAQRAREVSQMCLGGAGFSQVIRQEITRMSFIDFQYREEFFLGEPRKIQKLSELNLNSSRTRHHGFVTSLEGFWQRKDT